MKRFLLLIAFAIGLSFVAVEAADKTNEGSEDEILRKSNLYEQTPFPGFPLPFSALNNPKTNAAVSTGYYFVDSDDQAPDYWRPSSDWVDTNTERSTWRRVMSGPRQVDSNYWKQHPEEGLRFFRNPAIPVTGSYFEHGDLYGTDSTDDAIAGPIPIGFPFFFNGLRMDSFYVSTNGIISLTNRRYTYDDGGNRTILPGQTDAYDPQSIDWFVRARAGNGLDDGTADNYGYIVATGNAPTNRYGGLRQRGGHFQQVSSGQRAHLIAPFFGDHQLSQFHKSLNVPDDAGQVWYKRDQSGEKLIIFYANIQPIRTLYTPAGTHTGQLDIRYGEENWIAASAQVTLNRKDSSVQINYGIFDGTVLIDLGYRKIAVKPDVVFRYNTSVGVSGYARHVNYGVAGGPQYPWAGEYQQYTYYFSNFRTPNAIFPRSWLAIKFKQWQNSLRVVDIQYKVRKQDANADLEFTERIPTAQVNNYELMAGEERIGAIQPIALIQNLTNEIQGPGGVNFVKQDLEFRSRFKILNVATDRVVYNRIINIDSTCLALPEDQAHECTGDPSVRVDYVNVTIKNNSYETTENEFPGSNLLNGIPPYGYTQIQFPPFEPNEFLQNHIGRMKAFIIADPTDPSTQEKIGDEWPFDDTASVNLFVMRRLDKFADDVTEFHFIERALMPSVLKWVNIDAQVVSGEEVSIHPLPPRGAFPAHNNENLSLESPVIKMDRLTLDQMEGNDIIASFPIDMRNKYKSVLSLAVQRGTKRPQNNWERGWGDQELIGPEPRTVLNSNELDPWTQSAMSASRYPDELNVEFALPSPDKIQFITNIPAKNWRVHWRRGDAKPETGMAAITIFGAGGYMTGFFEKDRDSALAPPTSTDPGGLRANIFDDGVDWEFKRYFVTIPDTLINSPNEGAKNFRFRIRSNSTNDKKCITCIPDDNDPWYVDNVRILFWSPEAYDIEVSAVKIRWPYTQVPASQATEVPVSVSLSNNTSNNAPSFQIGVVILDNSDNIWYCRKEAVPNLRAGESTEKFMPSWNARNAGPGEYRLIAVIQVPGGDLEILNDTTFHKFNIEFGDAFAYDPIEDVSNDVPSFSQVPGQGLSLFGYNYGGIGNHSASYGGYGNLHAFGDRPGSGSGQFATRFTLTGTDTIKGYQIYLGNLSQAPDDIAFSIYTNSSRTPSRLINESEIYRFRGVPDIDYTGQLKFNQYITYLITDQNGKPKPVVLAPGTYWVTAAQLGEDGIHLGASKARAGMRTTSINVPPPTGQAKAVGGNGLSLMSDKNFRIYSDDKNSNLINDNYFAFENTRGYGQWREFMPNFQNPGYAHLHHYGTSPVDQATYTLTRGTWIPMLRPYLGDRSYGDPTAIIPWEDCDIVPVELAYFDGDIRQSGIDLYWATVTEDNNLGFYIEKRTFNENDETGWSTIGFVKGSGVSNASKQYNYFDGEVVPNETYQYRLRQMDLDGTSTCITSHVVTLTFTGDNSLVVKRTSANPFTTEARFELTNPATQDVSVEVVDTYGNTVKSIANGTMNSGVNLIKWDGTNESGISVSNGVYLLRIIAGENAVTEKMTLVR